MVLVYAITRASQHGWSNGVTLGLLATAAALIAAFVGIEARSPAPLLPLRIFRLRTLSAANAAMLTIGATSFAQFFLLTLYLQEVLRYSAIKTGVAFIAITVTIVVVSNVGQALTTRLGARPVLSAGLLLTAAGGVLYAQMPAGGHYFWDVFPGLILSGIGLALSFVPVTIAGLTGVQPADAGVASGLINTSRQIGGSVGLAAVTTIAATATSHYAHSHAVLAFSGPALAHGFQVAFYALAGAGARGRSGRCRLHGVQAEGSSDGGCRSRPRSHSRRPRDPGGRTARLRRKERAALAGGPLGAAVSWARMQARPCLARVRPRAADVLPRPARAEARC